MKVSQLRQTPCGNRNQVSNDPDPGSWLTPALPTGWKVYSFHFFVDWSTNPLTVSGPLLMNRLVDFAADENHVAVNEQDILKAFTESGSHVYFEDLQSVCSEHGKKLVSTLLPECEASNINDDTPFGCISRDGLGEFNVSTSKLSALKTSIQKYSGGPVKIGRKGLTEGTSAIECFLSKTDAVFPGDVDAVIVDGNGHIHYVIEFKKHKMTAPIGQHLAQRYYKKDRRKYKRLHALKSYFDRFEHADVSLVIFYYSTKRPEMRLQLVGKLDDREIEIVRDTGDVTVKGMSDPEISQKVTSWLGIPR